MLIYTGPASSVSRFFKSQGFSVPANTNPIEHFVDLLSVDYSSPESEQESRKRIDSLAEAWKRISNVERIVRKIPSKNIERKGGVRKNDGAKLKQRSLGGKLLQGLGKFRTLFVRAWRQIMRDVPLNFARLMSSLFVSLLYGAIYNKLSLDANTIPDRLGLLQIAAVSTGI